MRRLRWPRFGFCEQCQRLGKLLRTEKKSKANTLLCQKCIVQYGQACRFGICAYCQRLTVLTRDHIIPRCKAKRDKNNMLLVCRACNQHKDNLLLDQWHAKLINEAEINNRKQQSASFWTDHSHFVGWGYVRQSSPNQRDYFSRLHSCCASKSLSAICLTCAQIRHMIWSKEF